jgi:hypothetical protein
MSVRQLRFLVLLVGLAAAVLGSLVTSGSGQAACFGLWAGSVLITLRLDRLRLFGQRAVPPNLPRRKLLSGR